MSKKIETDYWVNCPKCKAKLKQVNLIYHMKHVHNKKIGETEIETLETTDKKIEEKKTKKEFPKKTIAIISILFIVVIALLSVYFLSIPKELNDNPNDSNNQNITINYFVSIEGKGNYSSIQKAVDSASNNDTIYVKNSTYFENIIITKPITLIGEDKNTTIINGNNSGTVIKIAANYVKISGFTITNSGNILQNKDAGITTGSIHNIISDCIITSNNNFGLYLSGYFSIPYNIIKNNIFSNNIYGLYADGSKTNNISSNNFIGNTEYGLYILGQSDNNIISNNVFKDNNYAIRIKSSTNNTIIKNLIMNNKKGLYFCCGADNNIVYNNIFKNNSNFNAQDGPTNIWDNGIIGNYWSDYTGIDTNGDGIGDTPYIINNGFEDRFPLIQHI